MNIGILKKLVENEPSDKKVIIEWKNRNGEKMTAYPKGLNSWRGIYAECSFSTSFDKVCTVENLIDMLDYAMIAEFEGYKGGEFYYDENTEIHVDSYGNYTPQNPLGVEIDNDAVRIIWKPE